MLCALVLLASPSMIAADDLGAWAGVLAWYFAFGPGAHRRGLVGKSEKRERDVGRFSVLQGGKNTDDTFH